MNEFIKNPSRTALENDLILASNIYEYQKQNKKIVIQDGDVYAEDRKNGFRIPLGTMTDLAALSKELFGDTEPEGVDYRTFGGITFMTYYGHLIACGDGSQLNRSAVSDFFEEINKALNNEVVNTAGSVLDALTYPNGLYDNTQKASKLMGEIVKLLNNKNGTDYDNLLNILKYLNAAVSETPGSDTVIDAYIQLSKAGMMPTLVYSLQVDLESNGDVILEIADRKDSSVKIVWEEDGASSGVGQVGTRNICKNLSEPQWAKLVYSLFKDIFMQADMETLDNPEALRPNASKMARASKALPFDPLILDLNRNNLYSTTLEDGTHYDYGEDGMKEKTAWADRGDGFLVYDRNGDGIVNNAGELFGDKTLLADGSYADNGFTALAQYDENGDGVIDSEDTVFSKLSIWQDANGNGITDEGELKSLEELGIAGIGIAQAENRYTDENGNTVLAESTVYMADGSTLSVGALGFETDSMDTQPEQEIEVSDDIRLFLPNLTGSGNVRTLHQTMQVNQRLYSLVKDYMNAKTVAERDILCEQILVEWAGCGAMETGSKRGGMDAVHLAVIEAFYGREYVGINGANPNGTAGSILEEVYQELLLDMKSSLLMQTYGALCTIYAPICRDAETGELSCDLTQLISGVNNMYQEGQTVYDILSAYAKYALEAGVDYAVLNTQEVNDSIYKVGLGNLDTLLGNTVIRGNGSTLISGTRIDDTIYADGKSSSLFGGEGNDKLYGAAGDDVLTGGIGDDYIQGGNGSDTYVYNRGDGNDTIDNWDSGSSHMGDRLLFGEGIHAEEIQVQRDGNNMVLTDLVTGQTITVNNAYKQDYYYLENIEFADGTVWTREDVQELLSVINGTEENDTIRGYDTAYGCTGNETIYAGAGDDTVYAKDGNDILHGEAGNDQLYGENGDDILIGGAGDDYLQGGNGSDTYVYNRGDGNDTINNWDSGDSHMGDRLLFGDGILAEEIHVQQSGYDMVLTDLVTGQTITVKDAYRNQYNYLENVEFADGTVWTREDVQELLSVINGTEENDTIRGYDTAYGCTGNETIYAGAGDDTVYSYGGDDIIYGGDGADMLRGGDGNDILHGEAGNDKLYGENGDDVLIGGAGDDYLDGGYGLDTYIYNRGDGNDTINNWDSGSSRMGDRLLFGEGILAEEIRAQRSGNDMLLTDTVTEQTVTVKDAYKHGYYYLENIEFADGTVWTREDVQELLSVINGTEENDTIRGYDTAYGCTGNETIYAGAGDDTVYSYGGDDIIYGGDGADMMRGGDGNDILHGEAGNDKLYGEYGDDILIGGAGDDYLDGGYGSDTYIYNRGDGNDTINNWDSGSSRMEDRLLFGEGILAEEIRVHRSGNDMLLTDTVTGQTITVKDAYKHGYYYLENIEFADGTMWTREDVQKMISTINGTERNDTIHGYNTVHGCTGNETIYAGGGNDTVYAYGGDDIVYGGDGADTLRGGDGNDILYGEAGDDYLEGGNGSDTYIYNRGDGHDTIYNLSYDDGTDTLLFDCNASDLIFKRSGNHLLISVADEDGSVTVQNWYAGNQWQLDDIRTGDGCSLTNTQVDLLIQAMASFEQTGGLSWQDAAGLQDEQAMSIVEQYWTKQVG